MEINRKFDKYKLISFIICFVLILFEEYLYRHGIWIWDAADYWEYGEQLLASNFNLGAIDGFRGYFFPLFLGICNYLGGRKAWYLINAAMYSFLCSCVIPNMIDEKKYDQKLLISVSSYCAILSVLFIGLLVYPLSDLFALMCCCYSIYFGRKSFEKKKIIQYLCIVFMGVFAYWAYNVRTMYLFSTIIILGIFFVKTIQRKENVFFSIIFTILGGLLAILPQAYINYLRLNIISISVPAENIMLKQMLWGIKWQRYDTLVLVENGIIKESHGLTFNDYSGLKILYDLHLTDALQFDSWLEYFKAFFSRPLDFGLIYIRHFLNFIFPCWPEIYVKNLYSQKWAWGLLGVIFIFMLWIVFEKKSIKNYADFVWWMPILFAGILIIPGAVEYRYSLPIYLFGLYQLCFNVDYVKLKNEMHNDVVGVLIRFLLFAILCFVTWSSMLASESFTPVLL